MRSFSKSKKAAQYADASTQLCGISAEKASRTSKLLQFRYKNTREIVYVFHIHYIFPSEIQLFSPCHIKTSGTSYRGGGNESKLVDNIGISKNWEVTENRDKAYILKNNINGKRERNSVERKRKIRQ